MISNNEKNRDLKDLLNKTLLICPRCFKEIKKFKENKEILKVWHVYCPHCKKKVYLDRFVFYNCHKENGEYVKGRYQCNETKK